MNVKDFNTPNNAEADFTRKNSFASELEEEMPPPRMKS
jgi:hypothetical protein